MSAKHPLTLYREKQKLTITALAGVLGVSKATVSRWEGGRLPDQKLWPIIKDKTSIRPEALARFTAEAAE
jgi:DNA-binding transcriptional regulator YiaG